MKIKMSDHSNPTQTASSSSSSVGLSAVNYSSAEKNRNSNNNNNNKGGDSSSSFSFENPSTKPPNAWLFGVVFVGMIPIVLTVIILSIPINIIMWIIHILRAPYVDRRLQSLEKDHWIDQKGALYHHLLQSKKNDDDDDDDNTILIVGGGIGGLSMAHFLLRCGFSNVKVFEKHSNCGLHRGGGHGLIAGRWCYDSMMTTTATVEKTKNNNNSSSSSNRMTGQSIFDKTCTPTHTWNFDSGRWWLTAKVLLQPNLHSNRFLPSTRFNPGTFVRSDFLQYLSDSLPPGVLHLNHEIVQIVQQPKNKSGGGGGGVEVTFANGTVYRGRFVVGCDGSNSRVRNIVWGDEDNHNHSNPDSKHRKASTTATTKNKTTTKVIAKNSNSDPFYVDINVWWSVTPISSIPVAERTYCCNKEQPGPNRLYFEGGAIMHLIAKDEIILVVDYRAPSLRKHHKNWEGNSSGPELLAFMKVWNIPPKYWPIAVHASRVSHFAIPKGLTTTQRWWNSTAAAQQQQQQQQQLTPTVVLIGDAVHPTPHFFGQGANAAIQDAYCLTRLLVTCDTLEDAFEKYRLIRKPPADDIISKSYLLGLTETAGGVSRLVRDMLFFTIVKSGLFTWPSVDIMSVRV